jgi:hypothetical protein
MIIGLKSHFIFSTLILWGQYAILERRYTLSLGVFFGEYQHDDKIAKEANRQAYAVTS